MEYKDTITQLNTMIGNLNQLIASLQKTIEDLQTANARYKEQNEYLTKKLFGTSREKLAMPGQLSLFDEAEQLSDPSAEEPEEITVSGHKRKAKRTSEEVFKGIACEEVLIPLTDEERICKECGSELEIVGREYVRQEFQYTPAKGVLVRYYRETAKCPECSEKDETVTFIKADVPEPLIPHSYASASAVGWVMYQKYGNSVPLYRQEQDWQQLGVPFSRATLANWIIFSAKNYLMPMYEYFHRELVRRKHLMADETPVQVLKEENRKAENKSYMWLFRSGEYEAKPIILYKYTETRAQYNAAEFLKGFEGYLETDGYQGYNGLNGVKRCCCWAHVRRKFVDAVPKGKALDYANAAAQGVQYCNRLFEHERISKAKGHNAEQRKEYRMQKEKPIIEAFWKWVAAQQQGCGSYRLKEALNYTENHKEELMRYLEDGECSFSNNLSEQSIKPFTVGRKNWLFSDTPKGAEASAVVYSIVEIAKANHVNIYGYLRYLLEKRPNAELTDEQLSELAPWNPDVIAKCGMDREGQADKSETE